MARKRNSLIRATTVNLAVRPFCKPEHYRDVFFATVDGSKLTLDRAGNDIPYPHQVAIHNERSYFDVF